ncbi:MAG: hypothetical protein ACSHW1_21080, partial [Yoonia sp.]|uniref:hypothetical protein n=1 Tax=Yoonia sp. TaxID=2212373 RepID=UPI003EF7A1AC
IADCVRRVVKKGLNVWLDIRVSNVIVHVVSSNNRSRCACGSPFGNRLNASGDDYLPNTRCGKVKDL